MNTTTTPASARSRIAGTVTGCALVIAALTGCQTGDVSTSRGDVLGPTLRKERPLAPADIDRGLPADRMAEIIERAAAAKRERAERYGGLPADRVEDQIERETADRPNP